MTLIILNIYFLYPAKNLEYVLPNNTTYKILYPTTKTIPFGVKKQPIFATQITKSFFVIFSFSFHGITSPKSILFYNGKFFDET